MSGSIGGSGTPDDAGEFVEGRIRTAEPASAEDPGQDSTPIRPVIRRPTFVRLTPWLVLLYGAPYGLVALWALLGEASVDGKSPNFPLALLYGGGYFLFCMLAFSFWSEKPWSRYFLVALLAAQAMAVLPGETGKLVLFGWPRIGVVGLALGGWYFFLKPSVRAYFRGLQSDWAEQSAREPSIVG